MRPLALIVAETKSPTLKAVTAEIERAGLDTLLLDTVEGALDEIWERGSAIALVCVAADAVPDDGLRSLVEVVSQDWPGMALLLAGYKDRAPIEASEQIVVCPGALSPELVGPALQASKRHLTADLSDSRHPDAI